MVDISPDDLNRVAVLVGLPRLDLIPRPGQTATWSFEDWKDWGTGYGFTKEDRSKHSYVLEHETFPSLRIAKATTSSDHRSALNLGAEVRRLILNELRNLVVMESCIRELEPGANEEVIRRSLRSADTRREWAPKVRAIRESKGTGGNEELGRRLTAALGLLGRYGYTTREALVAGGIEEADLERLCSVIKSNLIPKISTLDELVETLEGIAMAELEDEQATEAAKANRTEPAAAPATTPKVELPLDKVEITHNAEVTRGKTRAKNLTASLHERIAQLQSTARGLSELLDNGLFPNFPHERFAELLVAEAKVDGLEDEVLALRESNEAFQARLANVERELEGAHDLLSAAEPGWKNAYVTLVQKLEPLLASDNFLALARGVEEARQLLLKAKHAIETDEPPKD